MQQFAFIQKGLKPHLMKTYVNQMVQEAEAYFATWGDSGEINLRDKFSELIILTASRCLMGEEVCHAQQIKLFLLLCPRARRRSALASAESRSST